MKTKFEILKHIVEKGDSKVFKYWQSLCPSLTQQEFIDGLKWLCDDPQDGGTNGRSMTREIGLTQTNGIVKLFRVYGGEGLCAFYTQNGKYFELWGGSFFRIPCPEKYKASYADEDGMYTISLNISLSVRDSI